MSDLEAAFPENAKEIRLFSTQSPDDYLGFIRRRLEMTGIPVLIFSAVDRKLTTSSTPIFGRPSSLTVYVTVIDDPDAGMSRASFSGVQSRDGATVGTARWSSSRDDLAFGFSRLAEIANRITHDKLIYAVE